MIQTSYVDLPDLAEQFADSLHSVHFDGQTLRFVLAVTRLDDITPPKPPTARQYPCVRVVMPAAAGMAFIDKLRQLVEAMAKQEALAAQASQQPPGKPN